MNDSTSIKDKQLMCRDCRNPFIFSTAEQQFFTADNGWQKAADLTAGQKLDTLTGPQHIVSAAEAGAGEKFGIIGDNVPTLFIGDAGVLAHDATPLQ